MSKPITLTNDVIMEMAREFIEALKKSKLSDGKVTYSKSFAYKEKENASLVFTTQAFAKMTRLIQSFDCEIAWHASCTRDEEDPSVFRVDDILVYPQEVTGVTVTMDEEKYGAWFQQGLMDEDERFDRIHFQGHSHVNMATNPSSTDLDHQKEILSQLKKNGWYIFMIANKKFEYNIWIFDLENNVLYETADVDMLIGDDGLDLDAFEAEAKKLAPKKTAVVTSANGYAGSGKNKPYNWRGSYYNDLYDDDGGFSDYYGYFTGQNRR